MQRNSFYRVNKETGDSARSYVNGENLPSFQPNVTGFVSHRRKVYIIKEVEPIWHNLFLSLFINPLSSPPNPASPYNC